MKFCDDVWIAEKSLFRCQSCGSEVLAPTARECPFTSPVSVSSHWATCGYRGQILATLRGSDVGCGCASSQVDVLHCRHFEEPVLLQASPRCLNQIRAEVPAYTGRTCRECEIPRVARPTSLAVPEAAETVAVIVTCHDYGRYLRQCLDSILAQSMSPATVILVDDASSDDTPAIAAEYSSRVRYLRTEFRNASHARNHGAAIAGEPTYYLFVDADNWLPVNYISALLAGVDSQNTGVVYCRLWHVNQQGQSLGWSPAIKPFSLAKLRWQNLADTCSLVRRTAFEQVGGWRSSSWGLQDWDLWLRIADAGWQFRYVTDTALNYRLHPASISAAGRGHWEMGMETMRDAQLTTVVTLFSGRTWNLGRWFADLDRLRWNRDNLYLVAVDNSRNGEFRTALRERLFGCGIAYTLLRDDSRISEDTPAAEFTDTASLRISNAYAMNQHMARLYSLASRHLPAATANVWSVEDDVGFPPDALERLATEAYRLQAAAVSACLRNRFADRRLLSWTGPNQWVNNMPAESIRVTGTGFFCLLVRRDAWDRIAWRPGVTGADRHPYYDWAACHDISEVGAVYLAPVRCQHWQKDGTCLEV